MSDFENVPAAADLCLLDELDEEVESELEEDEETKKWRSNGKHIYVTWSKSKIEEKEVFHQKLLAILLPGVRLYGGREKHQDGTPHYHVVMSFLHKVNWPDAASEFHIEGDTNALRFEKPKPRQKLAGFLENTQSYCEKDGDTFGERLSLEGAVAEEKRKWQDVIDEPDEKKAWSLIRELEPREWMLNHPSLERAIGKKRARVVYAEQSPPLSEPQHVPGYWSHPPRDVGISHPNIHACNDALFATSQTANDSHIFSSYTRDAIPNPFLDFNADLGGNNNRNSIITVANLPYAPTHDQGGAIVQPVDSMDNGASNLNGYTPHMFPPVLHSASAPGFLTQHGFAGNIAQNHAGFQDQYVMPAQITMQPQMFPAMMPGTAPFYPPMAMPGTQRTPCSFCTETFARPSDLDRHWQSVHLGIKYHCFWLGCHNNRGRGYCRLEKLRTHQKQKHGFA
jgi:Geminivirus Rep catalytic domain